MNSKTKRITAIGMLCAITYVTMVVGRIPIILFLKYDPSDVIVTLGGFIWGPMTSCIVSVIVATLEMITVSDRVSRKSCRKVVVTRFFVVNDLFSTALLLPEYCHPASKDLSLPVRHTRTLRKSAYPRNQYPSSFSAAGL